MPLPTHFLYALPSPFFICLVRGHPFKPLNVWMERRQSAKLKHFGEKYACKRECWGQLLSSSPLRPPPSARVSLSALKMEFLWKNMHQNHWNHHGIVRGSETGWIYLLSLQAPEMERPIPHGHGYWVSLCNEDRCTGFLQTRTKRNFPSDGSQL